MAQIPDHIKNDPVLQEIVRRLVEAYDPIRVYLFGSKVRGDDTPDSDYDLMIIVPDDAPEKLSKPRLALDVLWKYGVGADVLVWPIKKFESIIHLKASLPATILNEGYVVYD
ncbi:nucleotidyltransferase domain-containing protein [bacterium]|nr:nucleotidyltransferase domain-containing protein [bacterium]